MFKIRDQLGPKFGPIRSKVWANYVQNSAQLGPKFGPIRSKIRANSVQNSGQLRPFLENFHNVLFHQNLYSKKKNL